MREQPRSLNSFEHARKVADAVLYEGYLLYPYRASAPKNLLRWQFGVLVPRGFSGEEPDPSALGAACLLEAAADATLDVRVRFLQLQARRPEVATDDGFEAVPSVEVGDRRLLAFEEAREHEVDHTAIAVGRLLDEEIALPVEVDGGREVELVPGPDGAVAARIIRTRSPVAGVVRLRAERLDTAGDVVRLHVRVENTADRNPAEPDDRSRALRRSLIAAHVLVGASGGRFLSVIDPPDELTAAARAVRGERAWPVLAGPEGSHDAVLIAPIVLPDHPAVAPESQGDFFDATEIDELLTLRVRTMTPEEKLEAIATDDRAAAIVTRADSITEDAFAALHGAVREKSAVEPLDDGTTPDHVVVRGVSVSCGSRVVLRPVRRSDPMDLFLAGKTATVRSIRADYDDQIHLAVTVDDDPAADLHDWYGRYLYFSPDEVEPTA